MTRVFKVSEYEKAFECAQELHDEGCEVSIELHDNKITLTYREAEKCNSVR